jgi:hypothetical protein
LEIAAEAIEILPVSVGYRFDRWIGAIAVRGRKRDIGRGSSDRRAPSRSADA